MKRYENESSKEHCDRNASSPITDNNKKQPQYNQIKPEQHHLTVEQIDVDGRDCERRWGWMMNGKISGLQVAGFDLMSFCYTNAVTQIVSI
jgi:hypothetical protein